MKELFKINKLFKVIGIFIVLVSYYFVKGCGCSRVSDKKVKISQIKEEDLFDAKKEDKNLVINNKELYTKHDNKNQILFEGKRSSELTRGIISTINNNSEMQHLEDALKMIKSNNLEGALRLVQRVESQNRSDPYILMHTSYLQAMIYHRMNKPSKRKEAMNNLLKYMEEMQSDIRFQMGFLDGQDAEELIRMSINKYENKYKFK